MVHVKFKYISHLQRNTTFDILLKQGVFLSQLNNNILIGQILNFNSGICLSPNMK